MSAAWGGPGRITDAASTLNVRSTSKEDSTMQLPILDTITTVSGSTYVVEGAFGALFVTRHRPKDPTDGIDGLIESGTRVPVDRIVPTPRNGGTAVTFIGGPLDRVTTSRRVS